MKTAQQKIDALRALMKKHDLDGYFVPHADEHQNEYGPSYTERLAWLTDFTGSAGYGFVLSDKAVVLVDGRYTLQAAEQLDGNVYDQGDYTKTHPFEWAAENLHEAAVIGYDPKLVTVAQINNFQEKIADKRIDLKPIEGNLIDDIWDDQPKAPASDIFQLDDALVGQTYLEKIKSISDKVSADFLVISALDCIAWLLNLRASDIKTSPLFLSYALLDTKNRALTLFTDKSRMNIDMDNVEIREYNEIKEALLSQDSFVAYDPSETSCWIKNMIKNLKEQKNPIFLMKACKNETEANSMREAHRLDGLALSKFFHWFDQNKESGSLTETSVEKNLYDFRAESNAFKGISFDPISGFESNGAVIHYRAQPETAKAIVGDSLYLLDSGGQYVYGTTDLTRVVPVGNPTDEMKERYTDVLKGHIAIATAVFPEGTSGAQIDILARKPLWDKGYDFAHGTGHGVGMFLNVHEGPGGIAGKYHEPIREGMVLSNEPGYYKNHAYGIRIENLILVHASDEPYEDGRKRLYFETISYVPINKDLIIKDHMEQNEIEWLNSYHETVWQKLSGGFDKDSEVYNWLKDATSRL